jgi:hypothetical protein
MLAMPTPSLHTFETLLSPREWVNQNKMPLLGCPVNTRSGCSCLTVQMM